MPNVPGSAAGTGCAERRKDVMKGTGSRQSEAVMYEVQIDGNMYELSEEIKLDKNIKHTIAVVVGQTCGKTGDRKASDGFC